MIEEEEIDRLYRESMDELARHAREADAKNRRISRVLKKLKGSHWFYKGFKPLVESEKGWYAPPWEIVRELPPRCHHTTTNDPPLREYWSVSWPTNQEGDSYDGWLYIPVKESRWVKVFFSS